MPSRIEVRNREKLTRLADVLAKHADGKALRLKLLRDIRREVRHIGADQAKQLTSKLPKRGGLAMALGTQARYGTKISMGGKRVEVTLIDSWKGHSMKAVDSGLIRHPLFGNRDHWYTTRVPSRLLSRTFLRHERNTRRAIIRSVDELAREIARET